MTASRSELLKAVQRAHTWIAKTEIAADDQENLVRKAFTVAVVQLVVPKGLRKRKVFTQADADALRPEDSGNLYDPTLALAVCAAARRFGVKHDRLNSMAEALAGTLARLPSPLAPELALASFMLRVCGIDSPLCQVKTVPLLPLPELVAADRPALLELSRTVANVTAWGQFDAGLERQLLHLPALTVSCAREWDIDLVCALLRTCSYLKLSDEAVCGWCVQWLLDQQQDDGRFGLLAAEAAQLKRDPDDWQIYFVPTANAIWTLAEFCRPGLFLVV